MKLFSFRLTPGTDLKHELEAFAAKEKLDAAFVITCVGSLTVAAIRFAGKSETSSVAGPLEITSLTGTFSIQGSHFHITVTDENGKATGGHLKEGSIVRTTAELVIGTHDEVVYTREKDPASGYMELKVVEK
ncbi:MAG: PPC domain-containing DNA-binding protein [Bacteroidota bacterium]